MLLKKTENFKTLDDAFNEKIAERRKEFEAKREAEKAKEESAPTDKAAAQDDCCDPPSSSQMEAFMAAENCKNPPLGGENCDEEGGSGENTKVIDDNKWWLKGIPKEAQKALEEMEEPSIFN